MGVLLIHGFTGTPYEVHHLGQRLAERGYTVSGPALPGHITTLEELDRTTWRDWAAAVEVAFTALQARCRAVAVAGQSLGGLLALHLAANRPGEVAAVASLAAPLWLPPLGRAALRLTAPGAALDRVTRLPKLGGSDVRDPAMRRANPCYPAIPVKALHQLADFMTVVDGELAAVATPTLVIHGRQDHTAPVACADRIAGGVGARRVRLRILEQSYHLITIDLEREIVAAEVAAFVAAQTDRRGRGAAAVSGAAA